MKPNTLIRIAGAIAIIASIAIVAGCSTARQGETQEQADARNAASLKADAFDLASIGCAFAISEKPALRPDFESARASLQILANRDTITATDVIAILQPVLQKVRELRGPKGALILAGGRLILNRATGTLAVENSPLVRALAEGVHQGFASALGNN